MSIEQFALFMIVPIGGLLMGAVVFYLIKRDTAGNRLHPGE
ncbi:hypothetical protein [Pararhizobium sp.]|nr:hypothetical protein [Pararhizobium sp.]MDO9417329.1 hypothetical protein [Pararhizobium sp.]